MNIDCKKKFKNFLPPIKREFFRRGVKGYIPMPKEKLEKLITYTPVHSKSTSPKRYKNLSISRDFFRKKCENLESSREMYEFIPLPNAFGLKIGQNTSNNLDISIKKNRTSQTPISLYRLQDFEFNEYRTRIETINPHHLKVV